MSEEKGPTIITSERERWLERRKSLITASDAAAILGFDPRRDALSVYAEKVGALEVEETPWMRWGRNVEDAIARGYEWETGRPAENLGSHVIQVHPDIPGIGATLDRRTEGCAMTPAPSAGQAPLEIKAVGAFSKQQWAEEPPVEYQIQLQIQMACSGAAWGSLCALLGGVSIVWADILRNDRFLAAALPKLEEFRLRVMRRDPPPVGETVRDSTLDALRALYPTDDGASIALPQDTVDVVERWEGAVKTRLAAEKEEKAAKAELLARMGPAACGLLSDGTSLTLATTSVAGRTQEVKPYSFRTLRRFTPKGMRKKEGEK